MATHSLTLTLGSLQTIKKTNTKDYKTVTPSPTPTTTMKYYWVYELNIFNM